MSYYAVAEYTIFAWYVSVGKSTERMKLFVPHYLVASAGLLRGKLEIHKDISI